jgi:hypothetical protein
MRVATAILLGAGLLAWPWAKVGAQSLYGPGGLILHPTAALPEKGQLSPGVLVLPQHNPVVDETRIWISGSLDYGATRDLEIGATVLKITNWPGHAASAGGFAKYRLLRETRSLPAVAAGFTVLGFGGADSRAAFMAFRKQVYGGKPGAAHAVILHAGLQYADLLDGITREELQPYGGVEIGLARRLTLTAEGRPSGKADFGTPLALALIYRYGTGGRLALTWANNGRSDSPRLGFGAGFGIGSSR